MNDFLSGLLDDAASLHGASLPEALARHREHRASPYADLLGRLVLTDAQVPDAAAHLDAEDPLDVLVEVGGGAGALEPAVVWARRTPGLRLAGVALRLRDEADLAHNAGRAVAMVDHLLTGGHLEEDVEVLLEPPRLAVSSEHGWMAALDEIAAFGGTELHLRFRVGGPDPADRPEPLELARCLDAALDRELPFACLGPLPAVSDDDGWGVLNLLAAARTAFDGSPHEEVAAVLRSAAPLDSLDRGALARTRRWLTSTAPDDIGRLLDRLVAVDR